MHRIFKWFTLSCLLLFFALPFPNTAEAKTSRIEDESTEQQPNFNNMSAQEVWTLKQLKLTGTADLSQISTENSSTAPYTQWTTDERKLRRLGKEFIKRLIISSIGTNSHRPHLEINGAYFDNGIQLYSMEFPIGLTLNNCLIDGDISMHDITAKGNMAITNCGISGKIDIYGIHVFGDLKVISSTAEKLHISRSIIHRLLQMNDLKIAKIISIYQTTINGDLLSKRIESRNLSIASCVINNHIQHQEIAISENFILDNTRAFAECQIKESSIKGKIIIRHSTIKNFLNVSDNHPGACLIHDTQVDGSLYARRSSGPSFDLSMTNIQGGLFVSNSTFDFLHIRHVRTLFWTDGSIPPENLIDPFWIVDMQIIDFKFKYFYAETYNGDIWYPLWQNRSRMICEWVLRNKIIDKSLHLTCAGILNENGFNIAANNVLYAYNERLSDWFFNNDRYQEWIWLKITKFAAGHGIGHNQLIALVPFVLLVITGSIVAGRNKPGYRKSAWWWVGYSFDKAIPFANLSQQHKKIQLPNRAHLYFVLFHQPLGYALALFAIAGIIGWFL